MLALNPVKEVCKVEPMFDYQAYLTQCSVDGYDPEPIDRFACLSGMIYMAAAKYPDLPKEEAHAKMVYESQAQKYVTTIMTSRGLGDTIAKVTHATGLDKLSEIYTQITGKDCGCKSRQDALNKLVPYGVIENG